METDNKAFWQRFAKLYGPVMERSGEKLYWDICERIRPHLKRDMNVLELACGTGQLSYPLSSWVRLWEANGFAVFDQMVLGGSLAPLCYAAAKKRLLPT